MATVEVPTAEPQDNGCERRHCELSKPAKCVPLEAKHVAKGVFEEMQKERIVLLKDEAESTVNRLSG